MNSKMASIIIPTYSQGHFISREIEWLLLQTYKNWELIIINDGSKHHTEDIINSYLLSDNRIYYFKNKGLGYSLNKAMKKSSGEFITYQPSDDIIYKEHLESLIKAVSKNNVICEWVFHPEQRHKLIMEDRGGGIYNYKKFYAVDEPIRFHSSAGSLIDEEVYYDKFKTAEIDFQNQKHLGL